MFTQVEEKNKTIEKYENELQEKNELVQQLKKTLSESDEVHEDKLKQAKDEFNHRMATLEQQLEEFKQVISQAKIFYLLQNKKEKIVTANYCLELMILFNVSSQSSNLAEEVVSLQNHIAELEDEKGNLQLRLVELDDGLTAQGDTSQLSLYSLLPHSPAFLTPFLLTSYLR